MMQKFIAAAALIAFAGMPAIAAPARMMHVTNPVRLSLAQPVDDKGLVTIFDSLADKYPKGRFWCCEGYNVMGPANGEQWMAEAFTPSADHTLTKVEVAVGWSQGANGVVISINKDSNGMPGSALKTWNVSNLQNFGTCCGLVVRTDKSGIALAGGRQYWIVLSTNSNENDTVDGWNVSDADQLDSETLASYTSSKWTVFQAAPGVAFALKGPN